MRWLKHLVATSRDEKIARLIGAGGMEGLGRYGLYWLVNECIAEKMEGPSPSCSVSYPISVWSRLLLIRGSLVFSALSTLAATGLVTVERDGDDIRVTNRNLLKYRDEYSRKSGHTPENVPPRTEGKANREVISNADAFSPRRDADGAHADPSEQVYAEYPRKEGRRAALKAIAAAIARLHKGEGELLPMNSRDAWMYLSGRTQAYARSPAGQRPDRAFIPHPATWFNQGRYLDDDQTWQHTGETDAANMRSPAHQRVSANKRALAEALARRGGTNTGGAAGADGRSIPEPRPAGFTGGLSVGFRGLSPEILPPNCQGSPQDSAN